MEHIENVESLKKLIWVKTDKLQCFNVFFIP